MGTTVPGNTGVGSTSTGTETPGGRSDDDILDQAGGGPDLKDDADGAGGEEDTPAGGDDRGAGDDRDDRTEEQDEEDQDQDQTEEDEDEEEQDTEEEEPPTTDAPSASIKAIKAKYPNLLKEFPQVRFSLYRDHAFAQVFPTVQEAKSAAERVERFDQLEQEVLSGNSLALVDSLAEQQDPEVLGKFAKNFLGTLYEKNKDAYFEATLPGVAGLLRQALAEGVRLGNVNLQNAAKLLSRQIFGKDEPPKTFGKPRETTVDPEKERLRQELQERNERDREAFREDVKTTLKKSVLASVSRELDPKNQLPPRMKQLILNDIIQEVDQQLRQDKIHIGHMNKLWIEAKRANYDRTWVARISNAYLARAKPLLSVVRDKALKETLGALGGEAEGPTPGSQGGKPQTKKRAFPEGSRDTRPAKNNLPSDPSKINWKETTDDDIIAGRAKLKS